MKKSAILLFLNIAFSLNAQRLTSFVNPLIGTGIATTESAKKHSESGSEQRGQTFPAVGVPFGMTNWTPQTRSTEKKCIAPYYFEDTKINGFRASHWLSGSCTQDYGSVSIMPVSGQLKWKADERASSFSHNDEVSQPHYYKAFLKDYQTLVEMTGASRAGLFRLTFPANQDKYLIIQPNSDEGEGFIKIDKEKNEITGYNPAHRIYQGWGQSAGFSGYFVIQLSEKIESFGTWQGETEFKNTPSVQGNGKEVGGYIKFKNKGSSNILVKIGTSFTSLENARKNLKAEIPNFNFDKIKNQTEKTWETALQKIQVKGGTTEQKTVFYTGLYHCFLLPRVVSDVDGSYVGFAQDSAIHKAVGFDYYDDFSMWDTYRGLLPLMTIIEPKRSGDMVKSLILKAEQGGWMPIFPCWGNYTAAMIGDHAISAIADAYVKGIRGFDIEKAYRFMRQNAFETPDSVTYKDGRGRRALTSYLKYNYVPLEDKVTEAFHKEEQVSRTLEYAFDDFALYQVAKTLPFAQKDAEILRGRSMNYKNVFDKTTGFVRGRYADGRWIEPFDPYTRAKYITEGTPYHYTWYVPHDVSGLMDLMGGKSIFIQKLDTFFEKNHYWHGNETDQQAPYLYVYAGEPHKTQTLVQKIITEEYGIGAGGLSGNEDGGQMSAWLVFSMMGFYPVCPSNPEYALGLPTFEEVSIQPTPQSKPFKIVSKSTFNTVLLNRQNQSTFFLKHENIVKGGLLELK